MKTGRCQTWIALLLLAPALSLTASVVCADELVLRDGSRLVGTLVQMDADGLKLETGFAGTIAIDRAALLGISAQRPMTVTVAAGQRATGQLQHSAQSGQRLLGTAFGDLAIQLDRVQQIHPADAAGSQPPAWAAEAEVAHKQHAEEVARLQRELEKVRPDWQIQLEWGMDGQTGNTERTAFRGRAQANRTTDEDRLTIYGQGRYARESRRRRANEIIGGLDLEVDVSNRWFTFGRLGLEFDEFENLDVRSTVSAGMGYFFMRRGNAEFIKGRAGLGFQHESFDDGARADEAIGEFGFDYRRHLAPWLLLTHSMTYYPTFGGLADYRAVVETAGTVPLGTDLAWKLKLGLRNEYDAIPRPDVDRLDTSYFVNMVYLLD